MWFPLGILTAALLGGDNTALSKAVRALTAADSYRFTLQESGPPSKVEATFQKNRPLAVRTDGIDFFRHKGVMVYAQEGRWQRTRTGTLSDPLRILGASAKVQAIRLPHEELAQLVPTLKKIERTKNKTGTRLDGSFDAATARLLARTEDRDLARGGQAQLWLDDRGQIAKYHLAIEVRGIRGNADVDGIATKTVTLGDIGRATLTVPAAAKKALE